jgi:hypothetical protein
LIIILFGHGILLMNPIETSQSYIQYAIEHKIIFILD